MRRALTLRIDRRQEEVALLTAAVEAVTSEFGLCPEDAAAVQLATVEAVNNPIEHDSTPPEGQTLELTLSNEGDELRIELVDRGEAIPAAVLAAAKRRAHHPGAEPTVDTMADGGRGLVIIYRLMTSVAYTTRGGENTLTMTLRLRG